VTIISGSAKWYTVAAALRDAVLSGLSNPISRYGVVPGAIAWDECDCGMLAVSVGPVYFSESFPSPQEEPVGSGCNAPYEVGTITVQVIRCAPQPQGQSLSPSTDALDATAQVVAADFHETLQAVSVALCALEDAGSIYDYLVDQMTPQGPEGGCVGGELTVRVSLGRN
jgi:hypothetical protein